MRIDVSNMGGNSASAFGIDAVTGLISALGAPVATGSRPEGVAITP